MSTLHRTTGPVCYPFPFTRSGPYQTVWRRSTNVNEFGMALFVPKPEPSSAHGGSGRYLLKVGIDPPTPERFPQLDRSED